jgi:hypothetical protein
MGRRGRGRGALAARTPAPLPRHSDAPTCDQDGLSSDDEDVAQFKREAAQLAHGVASGPQLPAGLDRHRLDHAIAHLQQEAGVGSRAEAEDALLATAEHWRDWERCVLVCGWG